MITTKSKLRFWLAAGYVLGVLVAAYPAYLLYQIFIPASSQSQTAAAPNETRLAELKQQLQLVSLQIHRFEAELVLGRKLYRQESLKDEKTTYLGQVVTGHDQLLALLNEKWSRLQNSKTNRSKLQRQRIQLENLLNKSDVKTVNPSILELDEEHDSNNASLEKYLAMTGPDVYLYWPSRDAYFVMTTTTASKPTNDKVTEFLQKSSLQSFMVSLPVNTNQRVIDKLQQQPNLTENLKKITQRFYFQDHWSTDNGHTSWLLRVNLEGPQGLSASLLPSELAQLRSLSLPIFQHSSQQQSTEKNVYSAVIFDCRKLSTQTGLFPRIMTPKGESVYTVSQTDPNRITPKGAMVYSTLLATLVSELGSSPLLISVQETRGTYAMDWVISEMDASKVMTINERNGLFFKGRIGVLLPD